MFRAAAVTGAAALLAAAVCTPLTASEAPLAVTPSPLPPPSGTVPTLAQARARWAGAPSRFVTVDGVPIHVREEGRKGAPVVVLLHGSIANLHEWDLVVPLLADRYRVVRFDWSPYGLSGPDPSGVYSTPRAAQLMDGLMRALGHDRFAVVATSNGANVALEYNRAYPGHAVAMAFSMLPLERPSQTRQIGARMRALVADPRHNSPQYRSREFYREVLQDTTPPTFRAKDWMVDSIHDANAQPGALARQADYIAANVRLFQTTDVGAVAEAVHVPVLLQWCTYDTVISQSAQASVRRFKNAQVRLINYPTLGHFPFWENPRLFTRDLKRWLGQVMTR
ncbi:alpha/beta fold hydrolase [Novosphingobium sp. FSY-8]|uniref:Alpha/beta fold hydrolase n=2 Tax=Novosphingobium ovatum TaxID=1908523 RepID=A0ABW9XBX5_9SPHN|nr:alpha/beta fold hydrolase [Novosphingobium ovatum]